MKNSWDNITTKQKEDFIDYVCNCYVNIDEGETEPLWDFFDRKLTREKVVRYLDEYIILNHFNEVSGMKEEYCAEWGGDTVDRELLRDWMLFNEFNSIRDIQYKINIVNLLDAQEEMNEK